MHITEVKSEERRGKRGVMGTGRLVVLGSMGFTRHLQVKATQGGATQSLHLFINLAPQRFVGSHLGGYRNLGILAEG